ncbi:MAG: peptidoglycan editing factor PgeF [Hyphomicrobiaceae bacterium]
MLEPIEATNLSQFANIRHGFFTIRGGVSSGIYASLNCGRGSNDAIDAVNENRRRVAHHLGATGDDVVTPYQIHSADVVVATAIFDLDALPKADAVVTSTPGLAIGVLTADCTPVLFADAEAGVVGAAHAGWRGAVGGVLDQTIAKMIELGAEKSRIQAAVGPCIHQPAYEVGHDFAEDFIQKDLTNTVFFNTARPGTRPHFDLPGYVSHRLQWLGVTAYDGTTQCTHMNESLFFSYRRAQSAGAGDYGRQISAILVT